MNVIGDMVGESPAIKTIEALVRRVAPTDATVLVSGESGSGKELVAQLIHRLSRRAGGPFLAVNCSAIAASLVESELFGFERGSFTGAARSHAGMLERASGGTLLLDEVTEMSGEMQTKLLRFLETRRFFRIGGSQEIDTDVRIVAATNRCPLRAVQDGLLRQDLLYRLAVFPIFVVPLRDRGEDPFLLAHYFLDNLNRLNGTAKEFGPAALETLVQHKWPGNVRELKNAIERAFILSDEILSLELLAIQPADNETNDAVAGKALRIPVGTTLAVAERRIIEATLAQWHGNKSRAARALGCSLKTLYNKLAVYQREQMGAVG